MGTLKQPLYHCIGVGITSMVIRTTIENELKKLRELSSSIPVRHREELGRCFQDIGQDVSGMFERAL